MSNSSFHLLTNFHLTGIFNSNSEKFPNFEQGSSKRTSRSDNEGPLDDGYGLYGLANDQEIDLSEQLSYGWKRDKRDKVGSKLWKDTKEDGGKRTHKKKQNEKPMRQKKIRFVD